MRNDQSYRPDDPLLDQRQIINYLGISRTQLWRVRRAGGFPTPLHLSQGISRWRLSQLQDWLQQKEQP
jgi:prophage regulatory protein